MDLILVPPLSPFNYAESKLKMFAYLKSHDVSIGAMPMPYSDDGKCIWLNNYEISYGAMCLAIPPRMPYVIDVVEFPSEIWSRLDGAFGQQNGEISTEHWEGASEISLKYHLVSITSSKYEVV